MSHDIVDSTAHILNDILHEAATPPSDAPLDACMTEQGSIAGTNLAYHDLSGLPVGSIHDSQAGYDQSFAHAMNDCNFDSYVDHGSWSIPSFTNPFETFLDVATQSTGLNAGEDQQIAADHAFGQAYAGSYQQTVDAQAPDHSGAINSAPAFDTGAASFGGFDGSSGGGSSGGGSGATTSSAPDAGLGDAGAASGGGL